MIDKPEYWPPGWPASLNRDTAREHERYERPRVSLADMPSPYSEPRTPGDIDTVNHPPHYTAGSIECIDAIQAALTPEEFRGYCKGNAIKYAWRERHKGQDESLAKAVWYLNRAMKGNMP